MGNSSGVADRTQTPDFLRNIECDRVRKARFVRMSVERVLSSVLAGILFCSCKSPATSVQVLVATNASPERSVLLSATVWADNADAGTPVTLVDVMGSAERSPFAESFTVTPNPQRADSQTVQLLIQMELGASGIAPSQTLLRRVRFSFAPRVPSYLRVFLRTECLNPSNECTQNAEPCTVQRVCEERGQTCGDEGTCVSIDTPPMPITDAGVPPIDVVAEDRPAIDATDATIRDVVTTDVADGSDSGRYNTSKLYSGWAMSCLASPGRGLRCWGWGAGGRLGLGDERDIFSPTFTQVTDPVLSAHGGGGHMCAVVRQGANSQVVQCWGSNTSGETSPAATDPVFAPTVHDATGGPWKQVVSGGAFVCAIDGSDHAQCWGSNTFGQLASGDTNPRRTAGPVTFSDSINHTVIALGAGLDHACAVTTDFRLWCWGTSFLGNGPNGRALRATQVATAQNVQAVSLGWSHSCFLDRAGAVYCWGHAQRVGMGMQGTDVLTPQPVTALNGRGSIAQIAAFRDSTCARSTTGNVYCWGANEFGQAGDGQPASMTPTLSPVQVLLPGSATDLSFNGSGGCAVLNGPAERPASVYCWGNNSNGQLGQGRAVPPSTSMPIPVMGIN